MTFLSEYFDIPGNIKQLFTPFVLDKNNTMHTSPISKTATGSAEKTDTISTGLATQKMQYFSFRPKKDQNSDGVSYSGLKQYEEAVHENGFIKILPASFYHNAYIETNNDIGNMLNYIGTKNSVTGIDILRTIPYISVREYLQDSKLNMIMDIINAISEAFRDASEFAELTKDLSFTVVAKKVWNAVKNIFGADMLQTYIKDAINAVLDNDVSNLNAKQDKDNYTLFVLKLPYILYYRLISTTSLNLYELPYNGKILWDSVGDGFGDGLLGGLTAGNDGLVGLILNWFGKNLVINTTPTWNGPTNLPTKVEIDFSLYNDSLDGAVKNYIFITTLLANNKWILYHLFLHSPCVYDVRIPGVNRLFMCTAQIKVEQKGVLRNPSVLAAKNDDAFGSANDVINILMSAHKNPRLELTSNSVYDSDMIRIPDVYDVHITFTSLLPNNFNNFMYLFYKNDVLKTAMSVHHDSFYNIIMTKVYDKTKAEFKNALNSINDSNAAPTNTEVLKMINSDSLFSSFSKQIYPYLFK